jgi:serine/threonine-protein kinase
MLVGQQLGPFLIEKELGAGAMGAVYRGKYLKTGQVVAIKIMAPGLGTSSDSAVKRFEREAKILKQLTHPNIVRLFGIGKHQGTAYYAMEYIQGESLDKVMARRDRMTWEEVVDLGQQLCSALQHAHEKGIVHRDLKPSNLMILSDGTLKLTDFGIAKDLDVTALTGANCTIGTASYMSPEQCRGDRDISHKSDLYSLGVVLYELVTGRKPFIAENAMDLFLLHVKGVCERPSRIVLDLPVWMDNLICQLLEKAPEQRPFDAAMVGQVLGSIQEKVEAQQSAGVDAARARLMDRPRGERNPGDEDREAARTLLGKPRGKKRKKKSKAMVWVQAGGLLVVLGGVITAIVLALQPPSQEALYKQAEKLMTSGSADLRDRGRDGPVKEYLQRYGSRAGAMTEQVRKWADDYDVERYERVLDKHVRWVKNEKRGLHPEAKGEGQELAFKAAVAESAGDAEEAARLWKEVVEKDPWGIGVLAQRHLAELDAIAVTEKKLLALRDRVRQSRAEPADLDAMQRSAFLALRQEALGDRAGAQQRYDKLHEAAAKEEQRFWQLFALVKMRQMKDSLKAKSQDEKTRVQVVREVVAAERKRLTQAGVSLLDVRNVAHEVVVLYEKDADFSEPVKEAAALVKETDARLGGPPR